MATIVEGFKHTLDHIVRRRTDHGPNCVYCVESKRHNPTSIETLTMQQASTRIKRYGCFEHDNHASLVVAMNIKFHTTSMNDVMALINALQTHDTLIVTCHDIHWMLDVHVTRLVWIWVICDDHAFADHGNMEYATVVYTASIESTIEALIKARGRMTLKQLMDTGCKVSSTHQCDYDKTYFGF